MKIRLEGTKEQIEKFCQGNDLLNLIREKGLGRITSYSKFYPNRGMAEIESEDGRVYIELD